MKIRIGTRRSRLAMWQTEMVQALLKKAHEGIDVEIVPIVTLGDRNTDAALSNLGRTGVFTRELEVALEENRCDIAVHSMKDLGTVLPQGLKADVVLEREAPNDAFISRDRVRFADLPKGSRIGTSSLRRTAMLKAARPDLEVINLRGNVHTRLRAGGAPINDGKEPKGAPLAGTIMAQAGLKRLGLDQHITELFDKELFLPAPAQGCIAIQYRTTDETTYNIIKVLHHPKTSQAVIAERTFLNVMEGGCQLPVGAYATVQDGEILLRGRVLSLDGVKVVEGSLSGADSVSVGHTLATHLRQNGGDEILAEVNRLLDAQ